MPTPLAANTVYSAVNSHPIIVCRLLFLFPTCDIFIKNFNSLRTCSFWQVVKVVKSN
jgi:hypothetical protein